MKTIEKLLRRREQIKRSNMTLYEQNRIAEFGFENGVTAVIDSEGKILFTAIEERSDDGEVYFIDKYSPLFVAFNDVVDVDAACYFIAVDILPVLVERLGKIDIDLSEDGFMLNEVSHELQDYDIKYLKQVSVTNEELGGE